MRYNMTSHVFHLSFLLFCTGLLIPTYCLASLCQLEKHVPLFVFGDSLSDAGNNNYINTSIGFIANYSPYGETFFKYPTGRFSDGRLVPDFIAEYAKLPLIPPYLQPGYHRYTDGATFASAGAGALIGTHQGSVVDLKTQLKYFKNVERQLRGKLGQAEAEELLSRAVYLINIRSNDYIDPFFTNSTVLQTYSKEKYVEMVIGNLTTVINEIYQIGGGKFWVSNLGPLGCIPSMRALVPEGSSCVDEAQVLVKLHNRELPEVLQKMECQLKGFKYSMTDWYTLLSKRINFPSRYGFKEGKGGCCGSGPYRGIYTCGRKRAGTEFELCNNPNEYVFFDAAHPTDRANQQFASIIWNGHGNLTWPYSLKELFEYHEPL